MNALRHMRSDMPMWTKFDLLYSPNAHTSTCTQATHQLRGSTLRFRLSTIFKSFNCLQKMNTKPIRCMRAECDSVLYTCSFIGNLYPGWGFGDAENFRWNYGCMDKCQRKTFSVAACPPISHKKRCFPSIAAFSFCESSSHESSQNKIIT